MKNKTKQTNYQGGVKTAEKVQMQIAERFGKIEAKKYNPHINCRTLRSWADEGYRVKRGSISLKSFISIKMRNNKGEIIRRNKTIHLFYILQVENIKQ